MKQVVRIGLAPFIITGSLQVADEPISVQADRTDEVCGLSIRHFLLKLQNDIAFWGLVELVSGLLPFELVLTLQFSAQSFQSLTKLNVCHVRHSQFGGEFIEQLRCLVVVGRLPSIEQPFDDRNGRSSFASQPYGARRKAKGFIHRREVHFAVLRAHPPELKSYSGSRERHKNPGGVVLNYPLSKGTGAGSTAQETPNLEFSKEAAE
ncbi:hypothetical protein [Ciceribacter thiooxidans]|uniref:Uncharacterized protein n=1 Tax=Ciceribacter thiooxidans TaxID=1969821 RepID=A0ABV7I7S8_9HYPH|nr:hypothetical protein [Ciceribacter thiooxidans]